MRAAILLITAILVEAQIVGAARASAAEPPPMVFFHAPADAPPEVLAARDALSAAAHKAGAAWIDQSPHPVAPHAPLDLRRAIEAYDALRYDDALFALQHALDEAAATGAAGLTRADLSDLLVYRGLVDVAKSDSPHAWESFLAAAVVDPARTLDQARFPPSAVSMFDNATTAVKKQPHTQLTIVAADGCTIAVDGATVSAPIPPLPQGDHFVRVACAGDKPYGARVTLATETLSLTPTLVADAPPTDPELLALGRARGARSILIASVSETGAAAPPTLWLRLVDGKTGAAIDQASVSIAPGGGATADVDAAATKLFTHGAPRPATQIVVRHAPARWYRSPWLWTAVGAVVATAIIVPFVGGDGAAVSADVRPQGAVPW